ncbi:DENN domain-containing protein 10-like, partial [Chrysoperla carnea]|uniref:DENN domain-containing protein 10-like n=1 Tax=Chrysoperla carnea TaxID=189513 RepID=UPI001D0711C8
IYTGNISNSNENGLCQIQKFNESDQTGNIKDLIQIFQLETILIFNAILLKRRVLVYHNNLHDLLKYMKAISSLVRRRDPNFYLHPWVEDNSNELLEFKSKNWYVVGTIQKSITTKTELFDLSVNIPNAEIQIMPNAKESFTMTKTHKEIALSMVQLSQDTNVSDYDIECILSDKVDDIITQLKSLGTVDVNNGDNEKFITLEHLRSKKFNANIEMFLFNLALAENIIML